MTDALVVHGLDLSYFTGKLEAYLRAKGLAYRLAEMDTAAFRRCARTTGIAQMPQVECPDGTWLTDTTLIIRHLERQYREPAMTPADPVVRFVAWLLEDFGDEALWRPALYYRWACADDARLLSGRLARGMLRDVPLPFTMRRWFIRTRQRRLYVRQDGITAATRHAVEQLYAATLEALTTALATRPFVLGERPTEADFGMFASMFRHFFCDPTPARLMRDGAPAVLEWVARLWALEPAAFSARPLPSMVPHEAAPLLALVTSSYLPYLAANAAAYAAGSRTVTYRDFGARFTVPVNPYRVWCLDVLQAAYAALSPAERSAVAGHLGVEAAGTLAAARLSHVPRLVPELPIQPGAPRSPVGREWRA